MNLHGHKLNMLGDSITFGFGTSSERKCFLRLIENKSELIAVRNYGECATRIARQKNPSQDPLVDRDFCLRYVEMDDDADNIGVFGGTNDFGHGDAPVGNIDDCTPYTFYGACNYLIHGLRKKYPNGKIFVITPLKRENENSPYGDGTKSIAGPPLHIYVDAIIKVCKKQRIPVLDLYHKETGDMKAFLSRHCPDGLHPDDDGHQILADEIMHFLEFGL